jgi:hypothetical protein
VHTVQQGGRDVPLRGRVAVGGSAAAEVEADALARSTLAGGAGRLGVAVASAPAIQRDLKGGYPLREGTFFIDMKDESHPGGKSGMSGTITFWPNLTAHESSNIRLVQILKDVDLSTGTDYVWTGTDAPRNATETTADPGSMVTGGFGVDHDPSGVSPRTARADPRVSPYYRDYWPNVADSHDGWKLGNNRQSASLWDYPGSHGNRKFQFETTARDAHGGHVYGTVKWTFTITGGALSNEKVTYHDSASSNYYAALRAFNTYYRNPGSSAAP